MKQMIIDMLKEMVGNEYLYFDDALTVKKTPHTDPVRIWAVSISPKDEIFLMDANQEWHQLEESDLDYHLVIASLWARIKILSKKTA